MSYIELPSVVWMGKARNEWALYAWEAESKAKKWASEEPEKRVIWSVAVPPDTVVYGAEIVPATYKLKQIKP